MLSFAIDVAMITMTAERLPVQKCPIETQWQQWFSAKSPLIPKIQIAVLNPLYLKPLIAVRMLWLQFNARSCLSLAWKNCSHRYLCREIWIYQALCTSSRNGHTSSRLDILFSDALCNCNQGIAFERALLTTDRIHWFLAFWIS